MDPSNDRWSVIAAFRGDPVYVGRPQGGPSRPREFSISPLHFSAGEAEAIGRSAALDLELHNVRLVDPAGEWIDVPRTQAGDLHLIDAVHRQFADVDPAEVRYVASAVRDGERTYLPIGQDVDQGPAFADFNDGPAMQSLDDVRTVLNNARTDPTLSRTALTVVDRRMEHRSPLLPVDPQLVDGIVQAFAGGDGINESERDVIRGALATAADAQAHREGAQGPRPSVTAKKIARRLRERHESESTESQYRSAELRYDDAHRERLDSQEQRRDLR